MATIYGDTGNNTLNGTADSDLIYGLAGNDSLSGAGANDFLDGGVGNDSMAGGTGNDRYFVDSTADTVTENPNAGNDRVNSYVSFTLGANLENLALRGSSAIDAYGNSLDNVIYGNNADNRLSGSDGNDTLIGGNGDDFLVGRDGNDVLTGGAGADDFAFNSPTEGIDTIKGFNVSEGDKIQVYAGGFGGGLTTTGSLSSDQFTIGSAAADSSDRFIYNSSTGGLFFDSDGTGSLEQVQFATLSPGLSLSSSDIYVTAPAFADFNATVIALGVATTDFIGLGGTTAGDDNPTLASIKIIFP